LPEAVIKTNSGDEERGLGSGDWDYSIVAVASKTLVIHGTCHARIYDYW